MKKISLTTKSDLNIYMSPVRQQLLHQLNIASVPMTPKMLADKLKISASSIQFHIRKLMSIGLIVLDHTELINGITASFYKPAQVTVQIGLGRDDGLEEQRDALSQDLIAQVYDGFRSSMKKRIKSKGCMDIEQLTKWGDILSGIIYLNERESLELINLVKDFLEKHAEIKTGSSPWEYAIIAYNAEELNDD